MVKDTSSSVKKLSTNLFFLLSSNAKHRYHGISLNAKRCLPFASLMLRILFPSLELVANRAREAGFITACPWSSRWSFIASSSLWRKKCLVAFLSERKAKLNNRSINLLTEVYVAGHLVLS